MSSGAYLLGRNLGDLHSLNTINKDLLFTNERLDEETLEDKTFLHCTFANISFKKGFISASKFRDCVFIDCYFRDTQIKNCEFSSSKFFNCNFTKVDLRSTDLRWYNSFSGCFIPYQAVVHCLPSEGNLRKHIASNLARESEYAGAWSDSQNFRQCAARGNEEDLRAIVRQSNSFYKEKYNGREQWNAFWSLVASKGRGRIWGYKKSHLVVLRNWAFFTFLFFPGIYVALGKGVELDSKSVSFVEAEIASAGNMMPGSAISNVKFTSTLSQSVAFLEAFIGLGFIGIAVSLLFNAIDRKRS